MALRSSGTDAQFLRNMHSGIAWNFYIHWTYLFTLSARNTFLLVDFDAKKRKITHRFQKNCNWANIFAKSSVIFTFVGYSNSNGIVENISNDEAPPHNFLFVWDFKNKEQTHKYERSSENKIADHSPLLAWTGRFLERKQI